MNALRFPLAVVCLLVASEASAGIPECGNVLIDADASCTLMIEAGCDAQCNVGASLIGLCAADLAASCDGGCTVEITGEQAAEAELYCEGQCADGGDVVCTNNCQGECSAQCGTECNDADDVQQCLSGCQSSCDVECNQRCGNVDVNSGCYSHCLECMTATFHVETNLECQLSCQADGFASCKAGLASACEGSCYGSGNLFCDGQLVATGSAITACADALVGAGISVELDVNVDVDIEAIPGSGGSLGGCSVGSSQDLESWLGLLGMAALFIGVRRRRRRA